MANWFEPDSLKELIRLACIEHPNLQKKRYQDKEEYPNPYSGFCYIASEAYLHLTEAFDTYTPAYIYCGDESDDTHWFLFNKHSYEEARAAWYAGQVEAEPQLEDHILDLTAEQFSDKIDYSDLVPCGFLTKVPSRRAQVLIDWVLEEI